MSMATKAKAKETPTAPEAMSPQMQMIASVLVAYAALKIGAGSSFTQMVCSGIGFCAAYVGHAIFHLDASGSLEVWLIVVGKTALAGFTKMSTSMELYFPSSPSTSEAFSSSLRMGHLAEGSLIHLGSTSAASDSLVMTDWYLLLASARLCSEAM